MKVTVDVRNKDLVQLAFYRGIFSRAGIYSIFGIEAFVFVWWIYSHPFSTSAVTIGAFVGIVAGLCGQLVGSAIIAITLILQVRNTKGILGQHTFVVEADGLRETTEVNESLHKWAGIQDIAISNSYIYISVVPNQFHMIPQRAFKEASEFHSFKTSLDAAWATGRAA